MKKKTVFGTVLLVLFVLQSQVVFANPRQNERLINAVRSGDLAGARTALQKGADANAVDNNKDSVLMIAIDRGNLEMARLLVEQGADIRDYHLMKVAYKGNLEMVRFLIERGADVNGKGILQGITHLEVIRFFIERGADINERYNGKTALHFAVIRNQPAIVRYLVESGININARDNDGATAASLAYDKGEMEIYDYLKANGARDFEPRQVAQPAAPASSSTTNVYVQQPAPVQSAPAPVPATPTLRPGRYACSGTNVTMEIQSPLLFVTLYSGYSTVGNGSYKINGNTIIITISQANDVIKHMRGMTYAYTIVSDTSFSGGGETWYRR
jgi:hypothetical protein